MCIWAIHGCKCYSEKRRIYWGMDGRNVRNRETLYSESNYSLRLNTVTYKEKMFLGITTLDHSLFLWAAISLIFLYICCISVYILIGWNLTNIYLVISRNTRKGCGTCPKLIIITVERRSGVFIANLNIFYTSLVFLLLTLSR